MQHALKSSPIALLPLLLSSCGPDTGDATIDITYDPCLSRPDVSLATPQEAEATQRALAMWRGVLPTDTFREPVHDVESSVQWIAIQFESAAPMFHGVYDDERGILFINRNQTPEALAVTIAHELGHAYGLPHVSKSTRVSVMNPGNTAIQPNHDDASMLRELWGGCDAAESPPPESKPEPDRSGPEP